MQKLPLKGFTLLEILLVVALMGVVAGIGAPLYQSFQERNDLSLASQTLVHTLYQAQVYARAPKGYDSWGVHIATSTITLFSGNSYDTRDTDLDEVTYIGSQIQVGGTTEHLFTTFTGLPSTAGTTTLSLFESEVAVVVSAGGVISMTAQ